MEKIEFIEKEILSYNFENDIQDLILTLEHNKCLYRVERFEKLLVNLIYYFIKNGLKVFDIDIYDIVTLKYNDFKNLNCSKFNTFLKYVLEYREQLIEKIKSKISEYQYYYYSLLPKDSIHSEIVTICFKKCNASNICVHKGFIEYHSKMDKIEFEDTLKNFWKDSSLYSKFPNILILFSK
jgi:hypothetical protein